MGKVVSLDAWRKEKEEKELDDLSELVKDMISELDIDQEQLAKPYFTELTGYDDLGMPTASVLLEPDIKSCCSTLGWVSYVLVSLNEKDSAKKVDSIIDDLEKKLYLSKGGKK